MGFSDYGNLSDGTGDFCIVWRSLLNHDSQAGRSFEFQMTDVHVTKDLKIYPDEQQDCLDFKFILTSNGTLKWTFRRKFLTCDQKDYALEV